MRAVECSGDAGAPSAPAAVTGCKSAFFQKRRYWMLRDHSHTDTPEQTVKRVKELVTDAIHRQLVSDVPVGTFLSGGLDSSLISSVAASYMRERGEPAEDVFSHLQGQQEILSDQPLSADD